MNIILQGCIGIESQGDGSGISYSPIKSNLAIKDAKETPEGVRSVTFLKDKYRRAVAKAPIGRFIKTAALQSVPWVFIGAKSTYIPIAN